MSFIAAAIGLAGTGAGLYESLSGAGKKPNYSNVKDPYQQTLKEFPGLQGAGDSATKYINSMLSGQLPADLTGQIRNAGATWGVNSGMPGSGASQNATLESLGLNSLQMQQQGMGDYMNFLTGVGSQQMPVSQQMTVANAAAAPDPQKEALGSAISGISGSLLGGVGGAGGGIEALLNAAGVGGSAGILTQPLYGGQQDGY